MENPFVYGEVVSGNDFCDREKEQKELLQDLKSGERIFLISPRRFGKSSLITEVMAKLKREDILVAYVDLFSSSSLGQLIEAYSQAITKAAEHSLSGFNKFVRDRLASLRPKVVIAPDGTPKIELDFEMNKKEAALHLSEVCELPQKIAQKRKKRFVVIFDEFQEISNLGGEKIEKAMRAVMQRQPLVSYLFAGSKKHMMFSMVSDKNRAFYKMARIMILGKIPRHFFRSYLENKFEKTGFKLKPGAIDAILDAAEEYPYNAQFICHKLWDMNFENKTIQKADIAEALQAILKDQDSAYVTLWETLSNHQKRLLAAIAKWGGENIQSAAFMAKGELSAASSVQTSKKRLLERDLIEKENGCYFISDLFFKEWIIKMTG